MRKGHTQNTSPGPNYQRVCPGMENRPNILMKCLSPMTTCKLICVLHHSNTDFHSRSVPKYQELLYIYRADTVSSMLIHSAPRKTFINQHPSSLIIYPHTHHTWRQYVIAFLHTVSSASFLSSPSNFLPLQVFTGPYRKFQPTDSLICISYIHFVVALYI